MPAGWIAPEGNIIYVGVDRPLESHIEVLRRLGFVNEEQAIDTGWIRFVSNRDLIAAAGTPEALESQKDPLVEATRAGPSSLIILEVHGPVVKTTIYTNTDELLDRPISGLVREARLIETSQGSVPVRQYARRG